MHDAGVKGRRKCGASAFDEKTRISSIVVTGVLIFSMLVVTCTRGDMTNNPSRQPSVSDVQQTVWDALADKKIYFGHMSVGFNIVDGIKDVMKEDPHIKLNIVETNDPSQFGGPLFAHSRLGKNHDPMSKIEAFKNLMDSDIGNRVDVAFFKFCFVDVTAATNVQSLFQQYRDAMALLKGKYPKTKFVHVTVPLTTVQAGPKAFIKKLVGRPIDGYADNLKRNEFNQLIRSEYAGKEPVFDLAETESSLPTGKRTFSLDGKSYGCLAEEYTHDGGHLNERGRGLAAQGLLLLLAHVAR